MSHIIYISKNIQITNLNILKVYPEYLIFNEQIKTSLLVFLGTSLVGFPYVQAFNNSCRRNFRQTVVILWACMIGVFTTYPSTAIPLKDPIAPHRVVNFKPP